MNSYAHHGLKQFILALGYKGEVAKDYFLRYHMTNSDVTVNLCNGQVEVIRTNRRDWEVSMIDTGHATTTGGLLLQLGPHQRTGGTFISNHVGRVYHDHIHYLLTFYRL